MILEAIITTRDESGKAHITPLGYRRNGEDYVLAPFAPSDTLDNLARDRQAVLNYCDDVLIIAGCLTGRRDWAVVPAVKIDGWRLTDCLAHSELRVRTVSRDDNRPKFFCEAVYEESHLPFLGFNRARAAVLEAAILVSRLDWLAPEKVAEEMAYLAIAVEKTAGEREQQAWAWLLETIEQHPRHGRQLRQLP